MDNPIIQKDLLTDLGEYGYDTDQASHRIRFLADLTGTPITSVLNNTPRLLQEVEEWLKFG